MQMKDIHRAYKDEIVRAYGFIAKIKLWNSNREPDEKSLLKMISGNFAKFREIICTGLDHTFRDRQLQAKEYRTYKFVAGKLTRNYVIKNFPITANNTDIYISLHLDMGRE
jgi:hypothetical protein